MSSGVDVIPKNGTDPQQPHTSDEIYFIVDGSAKLRVGQQSLSVKMGSLVYVAKNIPHHFYNITHTLTVLVTMAPAEQTPNILFLHDKKLSNQEIATVLNVNLNTVDQIIRKYESLGHL